MKSYQWDKKYLCTGANFRHGFSADMVGDVHSLIDWLKILFKKDEAFYIAFFAEFQPREIVKYIYEHAAKRLEVI